MVENFHNDETTSGILMNEVESMYESIREYYEYIYQRSIGEFIVASVI